jgi:hypothetical protein
MSQTLLVDKKAKMHSQLATGTMIPAKPSKPTKLVSMQHALTKQKQQHILIVPVQRKVRNISLSKQKHAKGSFWGGWGIGEINGTATVLVWGLMHPLYFAKSNSK